MNPGGKTVSVDTSVLLDVLIPDAPDESTSRKALNRIARTGPIVLSPVVVSELAVQFQDRERFNEFLEKKPFQIVPDDRDVAWWASRFFRRYFRDRSVEETDHSSRKKILPDFFIAAHTYVHADVLVTRDEDFWRPCFDPLTAVRPDEILS